jgi:replication factor C small subunit
MITLPWIEKYRPKDFESYIFHDQAMKKKFQSFVANEIIPNLLISGVQGTGKTTISKILIDLLHIDPADVLVINASDENSVDVIREKISTFANTYAVGTFKIIQLEEADYISPNGQGALRFLMEECAENCRFIATCNYVNKIIPALRSRFQEYFFKAPNKDDIFVRCAEVMMNEEVEFDADLLEKYISAYYPDIRKILNVLELSVEDGKLIEAVSETNSDYKFQLIDLLEKGNWREIRKLVCENTPREEYEGIFRFMYENLDKCKSFADIEKYESGVVVIGNYLYRHALSADPEINIACMFIDLSHL